MNAHFRKHPQYMRPALRSADAFRRYTQAYGAKLPHPNAGDIASAIARRHCAGRAGTVHGRTLLEALRRNPDPACPASGAIRWMLTTIAIPECTKLVVRCGVRYEDIAKHLRAKVRQRDDLVRYLNQFTVAGGAAMRPAGTS